MDWIFGDNRNASPLCGKASMTKWMGASENQGVVLMKTQLSMDC